MDLLYKAMDGLTQNEYAVFVKLISQYHNEPSDMGRRELGDLIEFLERMIEGKERQIKELEQEMFENMFKEKKELVDSI